MTPYMLLLVENKIKSNVNSRFSFWASDVRILIISSKSWKYANYFVVGNS